MTKTRRRGGQREEREETGNSSANSELVGPGVSFTVEKEIESTLPGFCRAISSRASLIRPTTEWIAKFLGRDNGSRSGYLSRILV